MATNSNPARAAIFGLGAFVLGLVSAFFIFYTARLLYVTRGLTATRAGGQGAFIGAVAFPILALAFGWCAWRCLRALRRAG
ncbi:MAG: hypothetical protein HYR56_13050 [Acidobacteria bacterium]|nr:hypothetical protein [Acidobacteriota bacterium]MBI3423705.1 hypothetical protein [Acidobacteriota bacterium]